MSWPGGIKPGPRKWEASTLEESHLNSLLLAIQNIYIWAYDQQRMLPPVHVLHEHTWTALGCRPYSTCKASAKHLPVAKTSGTCKSAYSLSSETDHFGFGNTTMKRLDQGHLHLKLEVPGLTCPVRKSNLASAMGGKHSRKEPFEQLVNTIEDIYISLTPFVRNPVAKALCLYFYII
jgi:hypothetical protein